MSSLAHSKKVVRQLNERPRTRWKLQCSAALRGGGSASISGSTTATKASRGITDIVKLYVVLCAVALAGCAQRFTLEPTNQPLPTAGSNQAGNYP